MCVCVCVCMWKCVCACVKWILCLKCPEVVVHVVQQAWPSSFKTADWMFFTLGLVGRVSLVKLALQNYNTICLSGTTCANQTSDFPVLKILSTDYPCRRKVYEILQRHGVDVPKYVVLNRPETESCKSYHVMWGHLVSCGIMLCQVICHMIDVMWCQGVLWCYMMLCMSCDVRWYVTWCNVMGCHSCVMWCHVSHDVMSHDVCRDVMVYVMWCHMMWCGVVWCHVVLCILSCIHNVVYSKRVTFLQLFSLPFIFFSPSSSLPSPSAPSSDTLIETDDTIEVEGCVFHKPFVEKPISAEDHTVHIYFPSDYGGGCRKLFRKAREYCMFVVLI